MVEWEAESRKLAREQERVWGAAEENLVKDV